MASFATGCAPSGADTACLAFRRLDFSDRAIDAFNRDDLLQAEGHNVTFDKLCGK